MSWYYFEPKEHGLVSVGEVDWIDGCYDWDTTTVFYCPEDGLFYWESGSGCSCNGPLEGVTKREDLESGTFFQLSNDLNKHLADTLESKYESQKTKERAGMEMTRVIEAAMRVKSKEEV